MGMTNEQRMNYCKDCIRSIYHDNNCDINRETNGYYANAGDKCYCKVTKEGRAEKYPWENK